MNKKDLTLPLLYRLGLLASIFTLFLLLKQQFTHYQQFYYHYLTLLNNLGTTALQNPEGIAQAQTIINQFNATTSHYTLILFWILPGLLIISYLFWEFITWKKILGTTLKPYWWRFLITNILSLGILALTIKLLWNSINFQEYTFNPNLLWFPLISYLIHTLHYATYTSIDQKTWLTKQQVITLAKNFWRILITSFGSYIIIIFIITGLFYVLTNYTQSITTVGVYSWSIITLLLTILSVYYNHYTIHYLRHHLSIKK